MAWSIEIDVSSDELGSDDALIVVTFSADGRRLPVTFSKEVDLTDTSDLEDFADDIKDRIQEILTKEALIAAAATTIRTRLET